MSIKQKLLVLIAVTVVVFVAVIATQLRLRADVVVGGKDFTEQNVLGEIVALMIEENSDLSVDRRLYLGGTMICFRALQAGALDLYVEYTGTGLVNILDQEVIQDPDEAYRTVQERFNELYELSWLAPLGFNNTYTLTMRRDHAEELGVEKISDLQDIDTSDLSAGFDAEFIERPDGYPGLKEHYGFEVAGSVRQMDPGLMYRAAADGSVDIICAFATDGRIAAYDLLVLEDDLAFFPPYYAAPLVRNDTLQRFPELSGILNRLEGAISDEEMSEMNLRVDEDGESPRDVARQFLTEKGLID